MASLTPTEEAFLTMCRMAGIEPVHIEDGINMTLHTQDLIIGLAAVGNGQVVFTSFQCGPRSLLDVNTISKIIDTFDAGDIFDLNERFPLLVPLLEIGARPSIFPIVAQSFDALSIERPELRPQYDRVREAWEATQ